jgi:hypothetical protein
MSLPHTFRLGRAGKAAPLFEVISGTWVDSGTYWYSTGGQATVNDVGAINYISVGATDIQVSDYAVPAPTRLAANWSDGDTVAVHNAVGGTKSQNGPSTAGSPAMGVGVNTPTGITLSNSPFGSKFDATKGYMGGAGDGGRGDQGAGGAADYDFGAAGAPGSTGTGGGAGSYTAGGSPGGGGSLAGTFGQGGNGSQGGAFGGGGGGAGFYGGGGGGGDGCGSEGAGGGGGAAVLIKSGNIFQPNDGTAQTAPPVGFPPSTQVRFYLS